MGLKEWFQMTSKFFCHMAVRYLFPRAVTDLLKYDKSILNFVLIRQNLANSMILHPKMVDLRLVCIAYERQIERFPLH